MVTGDVQRCIAGGFDSFEGIEAVPVAGHGIGQRCGPGFDATAVGGDDGQAGGARSGLDRLIPAPGLTASQVGEIGIGVRTTRY